MGTGKMNGKTNKLRQLEKNRYSILTEDMEHCLICHKAEVDIHEIYGGANRQVSMKNGFCIPLCRYHHYLATNYPGFNRAFQKECQKIYEQDHKRKEFMLLIGKNYLGD